MLQRLHQELVGRRSEMECLNAAACDAVDSTEQSNKSTRTSTDSGGGGADGKMRSCTPPRTIASRSRTPPVTGSARSHTPPGS